MSKKNLILFLLCLMQPYSLKADFQSLPTLPDFGKVNSYYDAVRILFDDHLQEIEEIKTSGGQVEKVFSVIHLKKRWFVKITREDCQSCETTHFDTEWKLKKEYKKYSWLSLKNAELILPTKGATFILEHKKHLIASYAWVPGSTFSDIYSEHFNKKTGNKTLEKAFYRYGQVLSVMHLDPEKPSEDIDFILNSPVRLHLSDRNGRNEKYHEDKDKIYILDLADDSQYVGRDVIVKEELEFWLVHMLDLYDNLNTSENCGSNHECLLVPFDSFAQGYISSLPTYNANVILAMLKTIYFEIVKYNCKFSHSEFCFLEEKLRAQNWLGS
ncbi:hypothetical protein [Endozoicomonas sp. ISHI1]|uniref:hypothetical protein n=2 Tax=unclassified Endozoicomonas TaxID=2644528 RepID=UPI0021487F84|nr:hypothetical protein [Endozoicomonas sp. ISHI1]